MPDSSFGGLVNKKPSFRLLALVLNLVFTFNSAAWAAPAAQSSPLNSSIFKTFSNFDLPQELGTVEETFLPPSVSSKSPFIVYIQDAHAQPQAQRSIQAILNELSSRHRIKSIALEAAFGRLNPETLNFVSSPEDNAAILDYLTDLGEITGAELFSRDVAAKGITFEGADDLDLYKKSLKIFRDLKNKKSENLRILAAYERAFEAGSGKVLNLELRNFLTAKRSWDEQRSDSIAYFHALRDNAKKFLSLDLTQPETQFKWPFLSRLLKADEAESSLKRELAARELRGLIGVLKKEKTTPGLDFAIKGLEALQAGKDFEAARQFFEKFYLETQRINVSLLNYPNFLKLAGLTILKNEIDATGLFKETEEIEAEFFEKLIKSTREKKFVELKQQLDLLRKMLLLEASREDDKSYRVLAAGFTPQDFKNYLTGFVSEAGTLPLFDASSLKIAAEFYDLTKKRDEILVTKTLRQAEKGKLSVLVAGGFHAGGIKEILKKKEIPFVTLTPRMTHFEDEDLYEKVMLEKNFPGPAAENLATSKNALGKIILMYALGHPAETRQAGFDRVDETLHAAEAEASGARSELRSEQVSEPADPVLSRIQKILSENRRLTSLNIALSLPPDEFWRLVLDAQTYVNKEDNQHALYQLEKITGRTEGEYSVDPDNSAAGIREELLSAATVFLMLRNFPAADEKNVSFLLNSRISRDSYGLVETFLSRVPYPRLLGVTYDEVRAAAVLFNDAADALFPGEGTIDLGEKSGVRRTENMGLFLRKKIHSPKQGPDDLILLETLLQGILSSDLREFSSMVPGESREKITAPFNAGLFQNLQTIFAEAKKLYGEQKQPADVPENRLLAADPEFIKLIEKVDSGSPEERHFLAATVSLYRILGLRYGKNAESGLVQALDDSGKTGKMLEQQDFLGVLTALNRITKQAKEKALVPAKKIELKDTKSAYESRSYVTDHPAPEERIMGFANYDPRDKYSEPKFDAFNQALLSNSLWDKIFQENILNNRLPELFQKMREGNVDAAREATQYLTSLIERMAGSEIGSRELEAAGEVLRNKTLDARKIHDILRHIVLKERGRTLDFLNYQYRPLIRQVIPLLTADELSPAYKNYVNPDGSLQADMLEEVLMGNLQAAMPSSAMLDSFAQQFLDALTPFIETNPTLTEAAETTAFTDIVPFGDKGDRPADMSEVGKKAYNVILMDGHKMPVPPGAVLATSFKERDLNDFNNQKEIVEQLLRLERLTGRRFPFSDYDIQHYGIDEKSRPALDRQKPPLLVSLRSTSMISMPGSFNTIVNAPMNDVIAQKMMEDDYDPWLVYDLYRRFLSTYAEAVHHVPAQTFIDLINYLKRKFKKKDIREFTSGKKGERSNEMLQMVTLFKGALKNYDSSADKSESSLTGLFTGIRRILETWDSPFGRGNRSEAQILGDWGIGTMMQAMVFGNWDNESWTAVIETNGPALTVNYKQRAQGPSLVNGETSLFEEFEALDPAKAEEFRRIAKQLRTFFRADQDMEMTNGYILQARNRVRSKKSDPLELKDNMVLLDTTGQGAAGGAATGVVLYADGLSSDEVKAQVEDLRAKLAAQGKEDQGILLVLHYITPDDARKLKLDGVVGAISPAGGLAHGALSARDAGRSLVSGLADLKKNDEGKWFLGPTELVSGLNGTVLTIDGHESRKTGGNVYLHKTEAAPGQPVTEKKDYKYDAKRHPFLTAEPVRLALNLGAMRVNKAGKEVDALESNFDSAPEVARNTAINRILDAFLRELLGNPNFSLTDIYGVEDARAFFAALQGNFFHGLYPAQTLSLQKPSTPGAPHVLNINGHLIRVHEEMVTPETLKQNRTEYLVDFSNPNLTGEAAYRESSGRDLREERLKKLQQDAGLKRVFSLSGDEDPAEEVFVPGRSLAEDNYLPMASPLTAAMAHVLEVVSHDLPDVSFYASALAARPVTSDAGHIRFKKGRYATGLEKMFPGLSPKTSDGSMAQMVEYAVGKGAGSVKFSLIPKEGSSLPALGKTLKKLEKEKKDPERKDLLYQAINRHFEKAAKGPLAGFMRYGTEKNLNSLLGIRDSHAVVFDSLATEVLENGQIELYFHFNDIGYASALRKFMQSALQQDRPPVELAAQQKFDADVNQGRWPEGTMPPNLKIEPKKFVKGNDRVDFGLIGPRGRIGKQLHMLLNSNPNYWPKFYIGIQDPDTTISQLEEDPSQGPMTVERDGRQYKVIKGKDNFKDTLMFKDVETGEYWKDPVTNNPVAIPYFDIQQGTNEPGDIFEAKMRRALGGLIDDVEVIFNAAGMAFNKAAPYYNAFKGGKRLRRIHITAPAKDGPVDITVVRGLNEHTLVEAVRKSIASGELLFCSDASCTTTGLSRITVEFVQYLESLGLTVEYVRFITHHGMTPSQNKEVYGAASVGKSPRAASPAPMAAVLEGTGANKVLVEVWQALKGRVSGNSHRDANYGGSVLQINALVRGDGGKNLTPEEINKHFADFAAKPEIKDIVFYSTAIDSTAQIVGRPEASIFIPEFTTIQSGNDGAMAAIFVGYDNEHGYARGAVVHADEVAAATERGVLEESGILVVYASTISENVKGNIDTLREVVARSESDTSLTGAEGETYRTTVQDLKSALVRFRTPSDFAETVQAIHKASDALRPLVEKNGESASVPPVVSELFRHVNDTLAEIEQARSEVRAQKFVIAAMTFGFGPVNWGARGSELLRDVYSRAPKTNLFAGDAKSQQQFAAVKKEIEKRSSVPLSGQSRVAVLAAFQGRVPDLTAGDLKALLPQGGSVILMGEGNWDAILKIKKDLPGVEFKKNAAPAGETEISRVLAKYPGRTSVVVIPVGSPEFLKNLRRAGQDGYVVYPPSSQEARTLFFGLLGRMKPEELTKQVPEGMSFQFQNKGLSPAFVSASEEGRFARFMLAAAAARMLEAAA